MNPFLTSKEDRLAKWKEFRKSLTTMDDVEKLKAVAEYWANAPLVSIAYDTTESNWPTPWEMIAANEWCRNSVAIGMEFTLRLAGISSDRLKLKSIIDRDIQDMMLVLVVDDLWVLNYDWGFVRPYPKTKHSIIRVWRFTDKIYLRID